MAKHLAKMLSVLDSMSQSGDRMLASVSQMEDAALNLEETISQLELSKSIGISTATINNWRRSGLIPFEKWATRFFYNRSAVIRSLRLRSSKFDHLTY